jgi:hypothetical protein
MVSRFTGTSIADNAEMLQKLFVGKLKVRFSDINILFTNLKKIFWYNFSQFYWKILCSGGIFLKS